MQKIQGNCPQWSYYFSIAKCNLKTWCSIVYIHINTTRTTTTKKIKLVSYFCSTHTCTINLIWGSGKIHDTCRSDRSQPVSACPQVQASVMHTKGIYYAPTTFNNNQSQLQLDLHRSCSKTLKLVWGAVCGFGFV